MTTTGLESSIQHGLLAGRRRLSVSGKQPPQALDENNVDDARRRLGQVGEAEPPYAEGVVQEDTRKDLIGISLASALNR